MALTVSYISELGSSGVGWGITNMVNLGSSTNDYVTKITIKSDTAIPYANINISVTYTQQGNPKNCYAYFSTSDLQPYTVKSNSSGAVLGVDSQGTSWYSSGTINFSLTNVGTLNANTNYYIYLYTNGGAVYNGSVNATASPPTSYSITYNANGGKGEPGKQTKYYGITLKLSSTTPTKGDSVTYPTGTITITYNANGGSSTPSAETGIYTNTRTVPYTFSKWNTKSDGTGTSYNAGDNYIANATATLYAQWNTGSATVTRQTNPKITMPAAISRDNGSTTGYTVTFNVNGGSSSHNTVTSTKTITYTFGGWNTNDSGTGTNYSASTAYTFSENDTLYAKWTPSYSNNAITLPTPTRSGYKFLGWATDESAASGMLENYTPSSNITLYAIWEPLATMFTKVSGSYQAGIPYVKVNNDWKRATAVYVKVDGDWKLSTR